MEETFFFYFIKLINTIFLLRAPKYVNAFELNSSDSKGHFVFKDQISKIMDKLTKENTNKYL